jgi:hypothetical protein
MKTRKLFIALTILLLVFTACREITVTTKVNDDGSFTRIITVSGDSSDVYKKDLPYPIDASWKMTSKKDTSGKGKFIVTYTKLFKEVEELQEEMKSDTSWFRQLPRHIDIGKRFGFFFSYIEYKEVYSKANPFTALPYKKYLTSEDILWLTGNHAIKSPSDSVKMKEVEDKAMTYLFESATAEAEKILVDGIRQLNDPRLDPNKVIVFHDSIVNAIAHFNNTDELIDDYQKWSGDTIASRLKEVQPPLFQEFERKAEFLENLLSMQNFRVEAEMPGLITATNSTVINGNRVAWDVYPMAFLLEDYSMTVESRVINVWAFFVAGFVFVFLISLLVVKSLKKHRVV